MITKRTINSAHETYSAKDIMGAFNMNKTKLIVVRDYQDAGKTTLIWMVFLELVRLGAIVVDFYDTETAEKVYPAVLRKKEDRNDFKAILTWEGLSIVIISFGDVERDVKNALEKIMPTHPDYIICAASIRYWARTTWNLFEETYTNLEFERVCFWSEHAVHELDEERVKRPTVEAIIKYMQ